MGEEDDAKTIFAAGVYAGWGEAVEFLGTIANDRQRSLTPLEKRGVEKALERMKTKMVAPATRRNVHRRQGIEFLLEDLLREIRRFKTKKS